VLGPGHKVSDTGLWKAAATLAAGLRSLFNRLESMLLLDKLYRTDEPYWRTVLRYCADGNLSRSEIGFRWWPAGSPSSGGVRVLDDQAVEDRYTGHYNGHRLTLAAAAGPARRASPSTRRKKQYAPFCGETASAASSTNTPCAVSEVCLACELRQCPVLKVWR
jgi:hypothetical protein